MKESEALFESAVSDEYLQQAAKLMTPKDFGDIIEERAVNKLCGMPTCKNEPRGLKPGVALDAPRFKISLKYRTVMDARNDYKFCSTECMMRSAVYMKTLSDVPAHLRTTPPNDPAADMKVKEKAAPLPPSQTYRPQGLPGDHRPPITKASPQRPTAEKGAPSTSSATTSKPPKPPTPTPAPLPPFTMSPFGSLWTALGDWGGPHARAYVRNEEEPEENSCFHFAVSADCLPELTETELEGEIDMDVMVMRTRVMNAIGDKRKEELRSALFARIPELEPHLRLPVNIQSILSPLIDRLSFPRDLPSMATEAYDGAVLIFLRSLLPRIYSEQVVGTMTEAEQATRREEVKMQLLDSEKSICELLEKVGFDKEAADTLQDAFVPKRTV